MFIKDLTNDDEIELIDLTTDSPMMIDLTQDSDSDSCDSLSLDSPDLDDMNADLDADDEFPTITYDMFFQAFSTIVMSEEFMENEKMHEEMMEYVHSELQRAIREEEEEEYNAPHYKSTVD